ncbi:gluconokinase [Aneurinibacillus sp. REN35]|uniref:gluconokinase n=1 Tax=Aneurinibacillus sp. REN35 TaxID=3237286 RepID=UPI0035271FFC
MSRSYCIGIDIGTTSTKAVLFSEKGQALTKHAVEYPLHTPTPSTAEQDPDVIYRAVLEVLKQIIRRSGAAPAQIRFVSFSSAMHSVIAVDESHQAITRCITWADNRSTAWAEMIKEERNGQEIYRRTGTPIHPMSPLVKIAWLRDEWPNVFKRAAKFISIKEYVYYQLFKQYVIDYSIASATGLFNLEELNWDEEALALAGITAEQLSMPVPTTHCMRGLDAWAAEETGLGAETPFIIGASDGVLSNVGVGAVETGIVAVTIGTSGAIRTIVDKPITDPKGRIFCYALTERHWVIGGPVNNGGMTLRWVRDELAASEVETAKRLGISSYEVLTRIAENVRPGADGLLFHPYLAGERAPLWNANARGSFFGLTLHHKKEHMIRAVLEGVIFNLYTVFLALKERILAPKQIQATGGFSRSSLWRQMMADIFHQDVYVPKDYESSCLGAVVLGMYALGEVDTLNVAAEMVGATHHHVPNPEHAGIYRELLPIYLRIMRKLEDEYESIAAFQRKMLG